MRIGSAVAEAADRTDSGAADIALQHYGGQLAISRLSCGRNPADRAVCKVRGAREHLPRSDQGALRHLAQKVTVKETQHIRIADSLFHHDRLRRIGGCGGSDSLHRRRDRLQRGAGFQTFPQDADDTGGMRRSRRYSRNFPGSDSRYAFHHRGADDRSDRPHSNAAPDFLDSRGHCGVHPRRL